MNITIFTEESGVKLPTIKKWKGSIGKGKAPEKIEDLLILLERSNLSFPAHDLELEDKYREKLHLYIRPAKKMFAGMFAEVRDFSEFLSEQFNTSLYIISGRYGLVNEDESIIPYISSLKNQSDLAELSMRTGFVENIIESVSQSNVILFFLPAHYIYYFLNIHLFDSLISKHIVIVSSKELQNHFTPESNVTVLVRKGVARIGSNNRELIIEILKSLDDTESCI